MKNNCVKSSSRRFAVLVATFVCLASANLTSYAGQISNQSVSEISPKDILTIMERVADWQLDHPSRHPLTDWTQGAAGAGMMALAGISGNAKYLDTMKTMGQANHWGLGPRLYVADDQCVGQTYAELYLRFRENEMIDSLRQRFDYILASPPDVTRLDFDQPDDKALDLWSWCDALFMAPPTWIRLYAATGEKRYLDFAVDSWWRTTNFLYDKREHLFYRDSRYFDRRESNGRKIFWSRGNAWVMAGLVRMLQYMPMNYSGRPRFEQLFKQMSEKILSLQQPDSLWHASLLDPVDFPEKETSGSGFLIYALAWGVNQGLLDRERFEPSVRKAWFALVRCVDANGKLTYVQPIGGDPQKFDPNSTEVYGTGAFLLAGSELYRMTVMENARHAKVTITNPAGFHRDCETVEMSASKLATRLHADPVAGRFAVMDGMSSRILDSQCYASAPDQASNTLLFQVDLAPHETRNYYVLDSSALAALPPPVVRTFARYVPERYDDFAWESDCITFRMYGQALMTAPGDALTSSGVDVWIKRKHELIANQLYGTGRYHDDNGVAMDDYRVGTSRGDGGLGVWSDEKLCVSRNYRNWRLITSGPVRSVFELTYDPWDVGNGRMVSEIKRISVDAGSWMSKDMSIFESGERMSLTIGVGLAERSCGPNGQEVIARDRTEGWMTYWQPEDKPKGRIGVAILLPKRTVKEFTNDAPDLPDSIIQATVPQPTVEGAPPIRNLLAITKVEIGKPFTYYFGACWDHSGDFTNDVQWENYVRRFSERRDQPLKVSLQR